MPQLVPFYFFNEVIFAFVLLTVMIYIVSKYILPRYVYMYISRKFLYDLNFNVY